MARIKCPRCFHVNPDGRDSCEQCKTPLPKIRIETAEANRTPQPGEEAIQFYRGQVLAGRYTVLELVGRGGMGCIYKVHDNTLGEDVALKTLLPQFGNDKLIVNRFINEARIARKLSHPSIVRVHDIGHAGKVIYISMEFLEGKSLRGVLDGLPPGQRLPLHRTLHVIDELCGSLEYAHEFTVHRDIKPENVMVGFDGAVKLMDFGISKLMSTRRLTGASVVMGTPFYMSPEQVRNSRDVDARADIYSVGVMLYEILTGNVPTGVPKPASQMMEDLPPELDTIVAKCVDPDPERRYQTVKELRAALAPIISLVNTDSRLHPTVRNRKGTRASSGTLRRAAGLTIAGLLILATAIGVFALDTRRRSIVSAFTMEQESAPSGPAANADELTGLLARARELAKNQEPEDALYEHIYARAEHRWQEADQERQEGGGNARALAQDALEHFVAALAWQKGMVYVPPGSVTLGGVTTSLPGYLIQNSATSLTDYNEFCKNLDGTWPFPRQQKRALAGRATTAITMLSYYDAQAYAAWVRRALPTHAQWARAMHGTPSPSDVCMVDNISEWTRTPVPAATTPYFGVPMIVCGRNPQDLSHVASEQIYERRTNNVGFRCVLELPQSPAAIRAFLAQHSQDI